ncbi:hypothetical protein [Psychroflexus montanilacus]|jgi:hypothetical protein|uniref:hypothetical protein n=1 Tax=Psychroflexus montanilacus TaxID=2873598 RepID=UPI001CC9A16B|nr:hypothetical protein [Psychroflexus montanilacus]MBZ9651617.1 hypothetical protein [Psychroflexus montanilacus]
MKLHTTHYITLAIVVLLLLVTTSGYAQGMGDIGFPDDVDDEPVAPINGLIALGLAVGGYLGIRKVKK